MRPLKFWLNFWIPWMAWTSGRLCIAVSRGSIEALRPWRKDTSCVIVTTDASTRVQGTVFEGIPASWLWSEPQSQRHINRLELEAVFLALKDLRPQLEQWHVLIRTDNMSVVSYINHQGLLVQACTIQSSVQTWNLHFLSIRAAHVPSLLNRRADTLLRKRDSSRRVQVAPRVGSDYLDPVRESWGGSVCHKRECALPAVLCPISLPAEGGCADITLTSSQAVCISSNQYIATGVMHNQGRGCFGDAPNWPNQPWSPGPDRAAGGATLLRICYLKWAV